MSNYCVFSLEKNMFYKIQFYMTEFFIKSDLTWRFSLFMFAFAKDKGIFHS